MKSIILKLSHYKAVEHIFKETFEPITFPSSDLKISWDNRCQDKSYAFLIDNKLIGFVISSYHNNNNNNLYIDYIAFDKIYRGKGLGTYIMTTDILINNKSVHAYPKSPELLPWYKRLGFYETLNGYYNFNSYNTRVRYLTI